MYQQLFYYINSVISLVDDILAGNCDDINETQERFLGRVLDNALNFLDQVETFHRLSEDQSTTDAEIAQLRHQLNNPITSMLGFTELMLLGRTGELTEGQQEALNAVFKTTRLLSEIIDEIIRKSREAGSRN